MSEPLLNVMKVMLLAGLYLFFVRVLWSVYNELRDPRTRVQVRPDAAAGATAGPSGATARTTTRRARRAVPQHSGPTPQQRTPAQPIGVLVGQLVMLEPAQHAGRTWALGNEVTIGRTPTCGVHLDDTYVSGVHARIFNANGTFMIEDLDSRNGTLHNDAALDAATAQPLHPGDRIRIGASLLEFS